jgi:ABC-2 type transport system ATP-binding protein
MIAAEPGGEPAIRIEHLSKRFGDVVAVDDLTFDVAPGVVTAFLGPNGAGKTTTLRMVLGLVVPNAGRATVFGVPYGSLPEPTRTVGAALEHSSAHPGRTVGDHLRIQALAGGVAAERIDEVLEVVGLSPQRRRRVGTCSLGQRQRLGLAGALLGDPPVLVLDEPANGLDPEGVHWLRGLLRRLAGEGRAVLVSSHNLAEVAQTADDVVIVHCGRLVASGALADVTAGGDLEEVFLRLTGALDPAAAADGTEVRA